MGTNRADSLRTAIAKTYARGGLRGFYQGLIPWGWIESSTAGGILVFTSSYVEDSLATMGLSKGAAGLLGGVAGGVAQAYLVSNKDGRYGGSQLELTSRILGHGYVRQQSGTCCGLAGWLTDGWTCLFAGVCTTMKTAEITRDKLKTVPSNVVGQAGRPATVPSTWQVFSQTYQKGGLAAINKGVNAVAIRQATNWGSRIGIARLAEAALRDARNVPATAKLDARDKILASAVGGTLGCWNHPVEVLRIEMQSLKPGAKGRPDKLTMTNTANYIFQGE